MIFTGKNQTLKLNTGKDLTDATGRIRYLKPDGTSGTFDADIEDEQLVYKFEEDDIDQKGTWHFQAEITSGVDLLVGEIARAIAKDPINV